MVQTTYIETPQNHGGVISTIEIELVERGRATPTGLLKRAVKLLKKLTIDRTQEDFHHDFGRNTAYKRIQIQPYARNIITGRMWELFRYIPLGELDWETLEELVDLQSGIIKNI